MIIGFSGTGRDLTESYVLAEIKKDEKELLDKYRVIEGLNKLMENREIKKPRFLHWAF